MEFEKNIFFFDIFVLVRSVKTQPKNIGPPCFENFAFHSLPLVGWFLLRFLDLVRDIRILTGVEDRFCPLLNVYFSDTSINGWRIF